MLAAAGCATLLPAAVWSAAVVRAVAAVAAVRIMVIVTMGLATVAGAVVTAPLIVIGRPRIPSKADRHARLHDRRTTIVIVAGIARVACGISASISGRGGRAVRIDRAAAQQDCNAKSGERGNDQFDSMDHELTTRFRGMAILTVGRKEVCRTL
jgi:hypothetical protein